MTDFTAFNASTHPIVKLEDDWNNLLDHGLEKCASYIVRVNGSVYEAITGDGSSGSGNIAYGGSSNAGTVDGTSPEDVINAAISNGSKVYIGPGTYTTAGSIKVLENDRLVVCDPLALFIPTTSDDILQFGSVADTVYRSHWIGGKLLGDDEADVGFHFYDSHKCSIRRVFVDGCNTNCGVFERAWASDLIDSWLSGGTNTLSIVGAVDNQSNHLHIHRSRLLGGSSACVDISGTYSENVVIDHCNIADSVNGIVAHCGYSLQIFQNYFETLSGKAIYLQGDTTTVNATKIKDNRFLQSNGTVAIYVDEADDTIIRDNEATGTATFIQATGNPLRITAWPNVLAADMDNVFADRENNLRASQVVHIPIYAGDEKTVNDNAYTSFDSHVFGFTGGEIENRGWRPITRVIFQVQYKSPAADVMRVRLYNVTDAEVVTNSEVDDNTNAWVHEDSPDLVEYFDALTTEKDLKLQWKVDGGGNGTLGLAILKIYYN